MGNIYLIGGEESFLAEQKLKELLLRFRDKHVINKANGHTIQTLDAEEIPGFNYLAATLGNRDMFAAAQTIVLKNFLSKGNKEERDGLLNLLPTLMTDQDSCYIFFESANIDKRTALYKELKKLVEVFDYPRVDVSYKTSFINNWLKSKNLSIVQEARSRIQQLVADFDLLRLTHELSKLELLLQSEDRKQITVEDLGLLEHDIEQQVWQLLDQAAVEKGKGLLLLRQLVAQGNEPIQIIGFLGSQLRSLITFYFQPASLPGFIRGRMDKLSNRINKNKLTMLIDKLANLDLACKTGKIDPEVGLYLYLMIV